MSAVIDLHIGKGNTFVDELRHILRRYSDGQYLESSAFWRQASLEARPRTIDLTLAERHRVEFDNLHATLTFRSALPFDEANAYLTVLRSVFDAAYGAYRFVADCDPGDTYEAVHFLAAISERISALSGSPAQRRLHLDIARWAMDLAHQFTRNVHQMDNAAKMAHLPLPRDVQKYALCNALHCPHKRLTDFWIQQSDPKAHDAVKRLVLQPERYPEAALHMAAPRSGGFESLSLDHFHENARLGVLAELTRDAAAGPADAYRSKAVFRMYIDAVDCVHDTLPLESLRPLPIESFVDRYAALFHFERMTRIVGRYLRASNAMDASLFEAATAVNGKLKRLSADAINERGWSLQTADLPVPEDVSEQLWRIEQDPIAAARREEAAQWHAYQPDPRHYGDPALPCNGYLARQRTDPALRRINSAESTGAVRGLTM